MKWVASRKKLTWVSHFPSITFHLRSPLITLKSDGKFLASRRLFEHPRIYPSSCIKLCSTEESVASLYVQHVQSVENLHASQGKSVSSYNKIFAPSPSIFLASGEKTSLLSSGNIWRTWTRKSLYELSFLFNIFA